jgi:hypothetical protein
MSCPDVRRSSRRTLGDKQATENKGRVSRFRLHFRPTAFGGRTLVAGICRAQSVQDRGCEALVNMGGISLGILDHHAGLLEVGHSLWTSDVQLGSRIAGGCDAPPAGPGQGVLVVASRADIDLTARKDLARRIWHRAVCRAWPEREAAGCKGDDPQTAHEHPHLPKELALISTHHTRPTQGQNIRFRRACGGARRRERTLDERLSDGKHP